MAIKLYKSQVNITNQSSTVPTAKLDPNFGQEVFEGQQALLGVVNDIENKHRRIQEENELIKAQTDYTDGYDENDGLYEIVRKNSESNNLDESMASYDSQTESWKNTILGNIRNKNVKRKFDAWAMQTNSKYGLDVSQTVRGNNRAMLEENIQLDTNRLINEHVTASNDLVRQDAYNQLFGNEELGILGMYDRLDEMFETPIGTNKEQYNQKIQDSLSLVEAGFLAENNPNQFLAKQQQGQYNNLEPAKLLQFTAAAEQNATNLKVSYILDSFIPIDPDQNFKDAQTAYDNIVNGSFVRKDGTVDEQLKNVYNSMSDSEKSALSGALQTRFNAVQSDITWNQNQTEFLETQANNKLYTDAVSGVLSGQYNISKINNMPWTGKVGTDYQKFLQDLVVKKQQGEILDDAGLALHDQLHTSIYKGQLNSLSQKILLPGETVAKNILERFQNNEIGINQVNKLESLINSKDNQSVFNQKNKFQEFLQANKKKVKGVLSQLDKFNPQSDTRFFDFSLVMEEAFLEGLSKGLTVNDLLNSESPNYIATKDVLLKYSRTLREQSLEISEGLEIDNPNPERKFKTIDEYENSKN
jgi:hypothetical protein|tara:strand:+ start:945 stop:2702 length:1758 start_codon:yes stop_codon:yes gene_type:complete